MSFQVIKTDKEASLHKFLLLFTLSETSFQHPTHRNHHNLSYTCLSHTHNHLPPKPNLSLMKYLSVRVLYADVPRQLPCMQSGQQRQTMLEVNMT